MKSILIMFKVGDVVQSKILLTPGLSSKVYEAGTLFVIDRVDKYTDGRDIVIIRYLPLLSDTVLVWVDEIEHV
jgi:hypothetical protein